MKPRWLGRRISAAGPYLTLCLYEHEFREVLRSIKAPNPGPWISTPQSNATAHFLSNERGRLTCIVCVNEWQGRDAVEVAGILVHEAVHVWQEYAANIGEHTPGREQEAYAIQSIAQELMTEFARRISR